MIDVIKADGTIEEFSEHKVLSSMKRAGVPQNLEKELLSHIKQRLYDNIPTSEIYSHIEEYLGKKSEPYQTKYSLKRALLEIGPTGFPFEVYVSEILKAQGYSTNVGTILRGKCVNHEVDVIAQKGNEKIFVECKYHNKPGIRSDIHVSMYTKARYDDLKVKHNFTSGMLVTNTKLTTDALDYANCEGLKVLSWSYPEEESLRDLIAKYKLYPITQFSFVSIAEKTKLLEQNIVLVKQICENPAILNQIDLDLHKKERIAREARAICNL